MPMTTTDRIEKHVLLRAPRSRVWRAISDSREFGTWFGVVFTEPFGPGATVRGKITKNPKYENLTFEMVIEKIEPERLLSFRWHPYGIDPNVDYSQEPMTLIELTLEDKDGGTLLRVVESGFDQIPLARRAEAFKMNDGGWAEQMNRIESHLRQNP